MPRLFSLTKLGWRAAGFVPRLLYRIGLGAVIGRYVLLLTTTGRKTGLPRSVPLQYEEIDGAYYIGSARGTRADWFQNLQTNPEVLVRAGSRAFRGRARAITDTAEVASFLALRLERHPRMVGLIMRLAGSAAHSTQADLETYAANRAVAVITPIETANHA